MRRCPNCGLEIADPRTTVCPRCSQSLADYPGQPAAGPFGWPAPPSQQSGMDPNTQPGNSGFGAYGPYGAPPSRPLPGQPDASSPGGWAPPPPGYGPPSYGYPPYGQAAPPSLPLPPGQGYPPGYPPGYSPMPASTGPAKSHTTADRRAGGGARAGGRKRGAVPGAWQRARWHCQFARSRDSNPIPIADTLAHARRGHDLH